LLLAERNEFSDAYESWASRMEIARQKNRPGDILVLADETPIRALHLEAKRAAGNALLKLRQYELALEQFATALAIEPADKASREKESICLGRLGRFEEARECVRRLSQDHPADAECWALAGRIEKERWIALWRRPGLTAEQMRAAAADENAALGEAIEPYYRAFIADPTHHYSGINALTLQLLRRHCGGDSDATVIDNLTGGVLWASLTAQERDRKDYWARASYAELCLLVNSLESVRKEYGHTVAAANRDWFALDSTRQTLTLLRDIDFRPAETAAALAIVEREIARSTPPFEPRQVFLFSGHMIDAPGRVLAALPRRQGSTGRRNRSRRRSTISAPGAGDLALAQAASGGDLLFLEACLARGVRLQVMLPFEEPEFIERSILPASNGEQWRQRYFALTAVAERRAADHARRTRPAAARRSRSSGECFRALQSVAAEHGARLGNRQGPFRLSVEWWRWRWPGRNRPHVQRSQTPHRTGDLARHAQAVVRKMVSGRESIPRHLARQL
jgi:tetratricopeptide (TPR) repeat protein